MTDTGHIGEAIAAKYYQQRGWLLLNHNYRTRMGKLTLFYIRMTPSSLPRSRPAPVRCWIARPLRWMPASSSD